jgi:hypothetical protein
MPYKQVHINEHVYLLFEESCEVVPPIKANGDIKIVGWDIPLVWAVDANNNVFGNYSGHGSILGPSTLEALLMEMRSNDDFRGENTVRAIFGMKQSALPWMRAAKEAGWTPPEGFNDEDYDWM